MELLIISAVFDCRTRLSKKKNYFSVVKDAKLIEEEENFVEKLFSEELEGEWYFYKSWPSLTVIKILNENLSF